MKRPKWIKGQIAKRLMACALSIACATTIVPAGNYVVKAEEAAKPVILAQPSIVKKSSNQLWINGSAYSDSNSLDAIRWGKRQDNNKYYFYVPSCVDANKMVVWSTFSGSVKVDGKTITDGAECSYLTPGEHTVSAGGATYKVVVMQSKKINTMFITTDKGNLDSVNQSTKHTTTDKGSVVYVDKQGNSQKVVLEQIKGRGNSSWESAQKIFYKYPYNLKFSEKVPLYGMKKSKKWALLANNFDASLVRDKFIYDLAAEAGMPYSPQCEFVDVYQNGKYIGNYTVASKIEIDKQRVDISDLEKETEELNSKSLESYSRGGSTNSTSANTYRYYNIPNNPKDITGGYIIEHELDERFGDTKSGFVSSQRQQVNVDAPEYASKSQVEYIKKYYQEMEDAVYSSTGYNSKGKHFSEYIDLKSAAQMYIIEEFTMEIDAVATSFFMYKEKGEKLSFGPVWDFDWSLGNYSGRGLTNENYWYVRNKSIYRDKSVECSKTGLDVNLLGKMYNHTEFKKEVINQWQTTFYPLLKKATGASKLSTNTLKTIQEYGSEAKYSAAMNFERYTNVLGNGYWLSTPTKTSYSGNVSYLQDFAGKRLNVMQNKFASYGYNYKVDQGNDRVIYFDNRKTNWEKVYVCTYSENLIQNIVKAKKVAGTDNLYKATISDARTKIAFLSTDSYYTKAPKTADMSIPSGVNSMYVPSNSTASNGAWSNYMPATPTPTPVVITHAKAAVFAFDNTGKIGGADLDEYTDGLDTYTYKSTGGNGTMTATVTGADFKHIAWSKDEYVTESGAAAGVLPAVGATKSNPWSANASVSVNTSTVGMKDLTLALQLGATKKGPANFVVSMSDGTNTQQIGTYTITANKTLFDVKFEVPEVFENKENIKVIIGLANTATVSGADLADAPTSGEFVVNNVALEGTYMSGYEVTASPAPSLAPTTQAPVTETPVTGTPDVTEAPTATPQITQTPVGNQLVLYYKRATNTSWDKAYAHYKVNGVWTTAPGVAMTKISGGYWTITIDLGNTTEASVCFNNGTGTWDSNSSANYTVYAGAYLVDQTTKTVTKMTTPTPVATKEPTVSPVVTEEPTATPVVTEEPTATPVVTEEPTATPVVTEEPTATPVVTEEPTATPVVTEEPTATPVVTEAPVANEVTVYYKRATNTSWKNAYVHYKVNGVWTTAPGVAMKQVSNGYWTFTIALGENNEATLCFNNGAGSWDSNSNKNYIVGVGTYLVDQTTKTVKELSEPTQAPATPVVNPTSTPELSATPVVTATPEVSPTSTPVGNTVTVYYKRATNTSWKNAYAHYKVNGVWTTSPGVKMQAVSSGYWKITIDLKTATEATICFNNGANSWDSNGSKNYIVKTGNYLVDQTKKTVSQIK